MIIAFPPCTHLAVSGAAYFEKKRADGRQKEGIEFFCQFLNADCEKIAIENPIGIMGGGEYIRTWFPEIAEKYGVPIKPTQIIQPYEFGHPYTKSTCLWLKGLKPLTPTDILQKPEGGWVNQSFTPDGRYGGFKSFNGSRQRSKTFPGVARAMATQWAGKNIETEKENNMELKMAEMKLPEQISFNYEEIKAAVIEKTQHYASLVYTDDQIKNAKRDRADLNGFRKALNDERIRLEKEYMIPFNTFKAQIQEIIQIIDSASASIDKQVKAFEDRQKKEKWFKINEFYEGLDHPSELDLERIYDSKWLNASTKMEAIQEQLQAKVQQINSDLAVINALPDFSLAAKHEYLKSLDLSKALAHANSLAEMKKAEEARSEAQKAKEPDPAPVKAEPEKVTEAKRQWIPFQAYLSKEEAMLLGKFLKEHGIKYKAI